MDFLIVDLIIFLATLAFLMRSRIKRLEEKNERLKQENRFLDTMVSKQRCQIVALRLSVGKSSALNAPDDVVSAVKYAVKHSHPDNGGNAEDFIRFQKCYEELTRR